MFYVEICLSKMGELWANVDDAAALYLPPRAPGCCQPGSPSGPQWAWAGRVIVACFFHNTCKLTLWTIWRILFFILSIILDENVKGNSQFDLKYFGSLKEYSQTSSSSTPIGNELGKKNKTKHTGNMFLQAGCSAVSHRGTFHSIALNRMAVFLYSSVIYKLASCVEKFPFLIWQAFAALPESWRVPQRSAAMRMALTCFCFLQKLPLCLAVLQDQNCLVWNSASFLS